MKFKKGKGFTLVEALVVVILIAIGAAIAFSFYNEVVVEGRQKAAAAYAIDSARTIGEAASAYYLRTGNDAPNLQALVTSGDLKAIPDPSRLVAKNEFDVILSIAHAEGETPTFAMAHDSVYANDGTSATSTTGYIDLTGISSEAVCAKINEQLGLGKAIIKDNNGKAEKITVASLQLPDVKLVDTAWAVEPPPYTPPSLSDPTVRGTWQSGSGETFQGTCDRIAPGTFFKRNSGANVACCPTNDHAFYGTYAAGGCMPPGVMVLDIASGVPGYCHSGLASIINSNTDMLVGCASEPVSNINTEGASVWWCEGGWGAFLSNGTQACFVDPPPPPPPGNDPPVVVTDCTGKAGWDGGTQKCLPKGASCYDAGDGTYTFHYPFAVQ